MIKQTAQQLNLPEELVRDVIKYYYKDIRKSLSALDHVRVVVTGLGFFNIKYWSVKYRLDKFKNMLKAYEPYNDSRSEPIKKDIREKIDQLQYMYEVCEGEKIKKEKIKAKRRELEKEYYDSLAKQKENMGGTSEHVVSQPADKNNSESAIENLPE